MYVLARSHKYRIALQGYGNILPSAVAVSLEGDCRIVTFVLLYSVLIPVMQRAYFLSMSRSSTGSLVVMKSKPWSMHHCKSSRESTVHTFTFRPNLWLRSR